MPRPAATIPLLVNSRSGLRVSSRTFLRLCRDNPDLRFERSARGGLIVMAPAGSGTGNRNAGITALLWLWATADGTGLSFDSSAGFLLPDGSTRSPDASWIALGRWTALSVEEREGFAPICPDFVVELTSPSQEGRRSRLRKKMLAYLAAGTRLAWLLDPKRREVDLFRPGRPVETLVRPDSLSGEEVLPGFVLPLVGILD